MNSQTPRDPHEDDAFADARRDALRAYRALDDEPVPPALDARVRAMARAALQADEVRDARERAAAAPARGTRRWRVPVSLAASVLLAVGVATQVWQTHEPLAPADDGAATSAAPSATTTVAPAVAPTAVAPTAAQPSAPSVAQSAGSVAAKAEAAPAEAPRADTAKDQVTDESRASSERQQHADSIAREPERAYAPPPLPAAPREADSALRAPAAPAESAQRSLDQRAKRGPPAAGAAATTNASAATDPAAWLARIEALRRAGRTAEADAETARFRAAFPDYPQQ